MNVLFDDTCSHKFTEFLEKPRYEPIVYVLVIGKSELEKAFPCGNINPEGLNL